MDPKDLKKAIYDTLFGNEGSVTMAQFTTAFEAIVTHILEFENSLLDGNTKASDELNVAFTELEKKLKDQASTNITAIKEEALSAVTTALASVAAKAAALKDGETPSDDKLIQLIRPLIPEAKNGKTPSDTTLVRLIKPLIPEPIAGSPDTGEDIIGKINTDKSKKLIRKEKVEGLSEIEDMARTAQANSVQRGGGSFVYDYDLSNLLNGVLKTFALPANAKVIAVFGSSTPGIFRKTTDYTTTASAITFTSQIDASTTLATGQTVVLLYKIL